MKFDPNRKTIGVDVDLTTLQSDHAWWKWLHRMTDHYSMPPTVTEYVSQGRVLEYNLTTHFPPPQNDNVDAFDFWRQEGVYDWIEPVEGAVESIKRLMYYYNIVFVTHNKGNGGRSKFNNLDRLFGKDNFSYVVTREKFLVNMDYMIDDRNDFLNGCAESGITCIKLKTPHRQYEKAHKDLIEMNDWYEISSYLINRLQEGSRMAS